MNLLLIEGEDFCHYTWIHNFNKLLSFGSNTHKFCLFCCQGFDIRYRQKLLDHMPLCQKYGTAPSLSWAAGLKHTKAQLEIPTDIDTLLFFYLGLRGGISMVVNQFARANNLKGERYKSNSMLMPTTFMDGVCHNFFHLVDSNE